MTSNIGAKEFTDIAKIGFVETEKKIEYEKLKNKIMVELPKLFRPEFLNRIDDTIVFQPLQIEHVRKICLNLINELQKRLSNKKISLDISNKAIDHLTSLGYDIHYGARPLKRVIQKNIDNEIANRLLAGEFKENVTIAIDYDDNKLIFNTIVSKTAELVLEEAQPQKV